MKKLATFDQLKQTAEASMTAIDAKQNKLNGTEGQIVGFDAEGNAIAQEAPAGGMTQEEADARYLQLSGGQMSGAIAFNNSSGKIAFNKDIDIGLGPSTKTINLYASTTRYISSDNSIDDNGLTTFNLTVDGTLQAKKGIWIPTTPDREVSATNKRYVDERLPAGVIVMWSGSEAPTGWALCDGTNGTPDLRGRFILGSSDEHELGETGGEETHTLTIDEMPKHDHAIRCTFESGNTTGGSMPKRDYGEWNTTVNVQKTGGGSAHNNMPPYYVLAYIMKL